MQNTVLKWRVPVDDRAHSIGGGRVLHTDVTFGPDVVNVWTLENDDIVAGLTRRVRVFGTGQPLPDGVGEHVGSCVAAAGSLVWHVFEVAPSVS